MIRVRTAGRMGNQMFQLAFAHATSRRLGREFSLGPGPRGSHATLGPPLWSFFELGDWARPALRWRRRAAFRLRHGPRPQLDEIGQFEDPATVLKRLRDGVEYAGFFQSEHWFEDYAEEVRALYRVRAEHRQAFEAQFPALPPYICMHVRRADYLDIPGGGWALPTSYFRDALASIPERERYLLVVVSDDPQAVAIELAGEPGLQCSSNPAIIDLQLLIGADVVVTSNSSFSWWGAWLNERPELRVIAPLHWIGFASGVDEPAGAIPGRWNALAVRDAPLQRDT
ncbi:MAG TPA: alpha-1,2-fucosyltransferase [Solirubrobacteraceae bacterium]|jgi:hypothetical protein|nr:alpha-1,2-fucosyltransferase [Solirubrobacteraceae bacterium]